MRLLTPLPQDDLVDVPAAARAAEAAGYDGVVRQEVPAAVVQEIRRIPSVFAGYRTTW